MDSCDVSSDLDVPSPIPPAVSPAPLTRARLIALAVWPTLAFVVLFGFMQETGFDAWMAARFHDPVLGGFPLRDPFWTSQILHEGAREVLVAFAVAILALWLLSWPGAATARAALRCWHSISRAAGGGRVVCCSCSPVC